LEIPSITEKQNKLRKVFVFDGYNEYGDGKKKMAGNYSSPEFILN